MKFLVSLAVALLIAASASSHAQIPGGLAASIPSPNVAARAFVLYDYQSGQMLAANAPDEPGDPASLTKLMTAYLAFGAVKQKKLALTQPVPVSQKAWKTAGSRMFIDPKKPATVAELLNGMITQSGNDASIALAEAIAGSEELFAALMNKEAQRLGLKNTHFTNATGWPDKDHYASARDLALLAAAIVRDFPEFFPLYSQKEYTYNGITQPNRNRLLWLDPHVDGMKTGHTEAAGYCLVSTARRGERRLISVVLGAASDGARTTESQKLLNYGFQFFDTQRVYAKGQAVSTLELYKGEKKQVSAGFAQDIWLTLPKDTFSRLKAQITTVQPLVAPLSHGQEVGKVKLAVDNATVGEYPVVALESVPVAGFFGRTWDSLRLMLK